MACQRCGKERVIDISSKCSDCFNLDYLGIEYDGYVPDFLGIGGDDYVEFSYCIDCGQIQGDFPLDIGPDDMIEIGGRKYV